MTRAAILVPGHRGSPDQPLLVAIAAALEAYGIVSHRLAPALRGRPSPGYLQELAELRAARDALAAGAAAPVALVGRSFGGRICAFLAADEPPPALAIVGHPISPAGRPRPRDEAVLASIACPTLVVQGDRDELGPIAVLERIAGVNPRVDLVRIPGAAHELSAREQQEAVRAVARWLDTILR